MVRPCFCRSWLSPCRSWPKRKSSPMMRVLMFRRLVRSWAKLSALRVLKVWSKLAMMRPLMVWFWCWWVWMRWVFSCRLVRRAGAFLGSKYSLGWGSKIMTWLVRGVPFWVLCWAMAMVWLSMAWCPRCTPSKLPMVRTLGGRAWVGFGSVKNAWSRIRGLLVCMVFFAFFLGCWGFLVVVYFGLSL